MSEPNDAPGPAVVTADPAGEPPARTPRWRRGALVLSLLLGLWILADRLGLRSQLTGDRVREVVQHAGVWGALAYVAIFTGGVLLMVPGTVFFIAARIAYGAAGGVAIAYVGALVATSASFLFARAVGGRALAEVKWAPARRVLAQLEERPVRTIALLRVFFWVNPWLNYVLAMSSVRYRTYLLGTALGLIAPVCGVVLLSEWVITAASWGLTWVTSLVK